MIRLTIDAFYASDTYPSPTGDMYLFHDDDGKLLYIGESNDVARRLLEHLGMTWQSWSSPVGQVVVSNLPTSLAWTVTVYELKECKELLPDDMTGRWLDRIWERRNRTSRRLVEQALIKQLHPALNTDHSETTNDLTPAQKTGTQQGAVLSSYKRSGKAIRRFYPFALDDVPGAALVDVCDSTARQPTAVYDFDLTGLDNVSIQCSMELDKPRPGATADTAASDTDGK